jgi:hypothetical protein
MRDLVDLLYSSNKPERGSHHLIRHFPTTGSKIAVLYVVDLESSGAPHWSARSVELTPVKRKALIDAYEDSLGEERFLHYGAPDAPEEDRMPDNAHLHITGLGMGIVDNNAGSFLESHGLAYGRHQQYGSSYSFAGLRRGYKYYRLTPEGKRVGEYLTTIQEEA